MNTTLQTPGTWRVEPAGPPNDRTYFVARWAVGGSLEFMMDHGDIRDFPSEAAAQATAAVENAKATT